MMFRTHIAIGIMFMLLFLPFVDYKWVFILVLFACVLLPDIDMSQSYLGKYKIFRPIQWIVKHRGVFHSFTFAVVVAFILAFYLPVVALPFFLGYSSHLLGDALTPEGIRPYWPLKDEMKWKIRTNGKVEKIIFYFVLLIDIILLIKIFI